MILFICGEQTKKSAKFNLNPKLLIGGVVALLLTSLGVNAYFLSKTQAKEGISEGAYKNLYAVAEEFIKDIENRALELREVSNINVWCKRKPARVQRIGYVLHVADTRTGKSGSKGHVPSGYRNLFTLSVDED